MSYPFYLAENLAAATHDRKAFLNLVKRNFDVIMNTHTQSGTMKKLRVAQLEALITRTAYRRGANPAVLFDTGMVFLEKIARLKVSQREQMAKVILDYCDEALRLMADSSEQHAGPSLLQRFVDEIERNAHDPVTVEGIAQRLGVSSSHLARVVKSSVGRPPIELIQIRKLSRARQQLSWSSVTQAALDNGFHKVSAFIALFRRHFGETPGAYKKRLADGGTFQAQGNVSL